MVNVDWNLEVNSLGSKNEYSQVSKFTPIFNNLAICLYKCLLHYSTFVGITLFYSKWLNRLIIFVTETSKKLKQLRAEQD